MGTGMKSKKKPSKAPAKKEPAKDKKVVAQIKKEYQNALNKYYGEIFKFRKNDNYSDYTMLIDSLEHNIDGDIFQIREKFQLIYQNEFRDSGANDFNLNLDELDYKKIKKKKNPPKKKKKKKKKK